jgi:hypothetical protein
MCFPHIYVSMHVCVFTPPLWAYPISTGLPHLYALPHLAALQMSVEMFEHRGVLHKKHKAKEDSSKFIDGETNARVYRACMCLPDLYGSTHLYASIPPV